MSGWVSEGVNVLKRMGVLAVSEGVSEGLVRGVLSEGSVCRMRTHACLGVVLLQSDPHHPQLVEHTQAVPVHVQRVPA